MARRTHGGKKAASTLLEFADGVQAPDRAEPAAGPVPELQLVIFDLGREAFGIPIETVREVVRVSEITRVPQAPAHVKGVTNLRGRILPVVELSARLGQPQTTPTPRSRFVIVEVQGRHIGLLVDGVGGVANIPADAVAPPPDEVISAQTDYLTGVARLDARLIILLDLQKALSPSHSP